VAGALTSKSLGADRVAAHRANMSDACDLLVRGRAVCKALRGPPTVGALDAIACKPLDTRAEYSADGRFLAVVEEGALRVLDAVSGAVLLDQPRPQVQALSLSPRGSFLLTWERSQQEGSDVGNLQIWRVAPAELVCHYAQKALGEKALWPAVRWSADEAIAFRLVTNEVHFFDGLAPTQQAKHKLRIEGVLQVTGAQFAAQFCAALRRLFDAASPSAPVRARAGRPAVPIGDVRAREEGRAGDGAAVAVPRLWRGPLPRHQNVLQGVGSAADVGAERHGAPYPYPHRGRQDGQVTNTRSLPAHLPLL